MFQTFSKRIKYIVSAVSLSAVAVYLVVIFFLYSRFLQEDYLQKATHINNMLAQTVSAHLEQVMNASLFFDLPEDFESQVAFHAALTRSFRGYISSNNDFKNIAFFTDTDAYYYLSSDSAYMDGLISSIRNAPASESEQDKWFYIPASPSLNFRLMYLHPVRDKSGALAGHLAMFIDPKTFLEDSTLIPNAFTEDFTLYLRLDQEQFCPLLSHAPGEEHSFPTKIPFSMEAMTQRDYDSFFISIPLAEAGLCLQTMVTPGSLYQKQFTMGLILAGIFLVSCLCVIFLISRYTRGLVDAAGRPHRYPKFPPGRRYCLRNFRQWQRAFRGKRFRRRFLQNGRIRPLQHQ